MGEVAERYAYRVTLREWLASFDKKPEAPAPELDMAKIKAEGFGPEAHDEKTIDPITGEEIMDDQFDGDLVLAKQHSQRNAVLSRGLIAWGMLPSNRMILPGV